MQPRVVGGSSVARTSPSAPSLVIMVGMNGKQCDYRASTLRSDAGLLERLSLEIVHGED